MASPTIPVVSPAPNPDIPLPQQAPMPTFPVSNVTVPQQPLNELFCSHQFAATRTGTCLQEHLGFRPCRQQ